MTDTVTKILQVKAPRRKRRKAATRVSTLKKELLRSRKTLFKQLKQVVSDLDTLSGKKAEERHKVTITLRSNE